LKQIHVAVSLSCWRKRSVDRFNRYLGVMTLADVLFMGIFPKGLVGCSHRPQLLPQILRIDAVVQSYGCHRSIILFDLDL
jgi:hypothetical protein